MDRLDAMQIFVRVAELGSFSAVAQQMNIARSVVTRQIAGLEEHLGAKLMTRSTRRLSLTSAGVSFLEKARVILNLLEVAETDISAETSIPRGNIRIGLPLTFGLNHLTPILLDFLNQHPEVSMEMDYTDRRVNLIEEGVDLSLRVTRRLDGTDIVRKLGTCPMLAVASPSYLARHGTPQHPDELAHHECLGYLTSGNRVPWAFAIEGETRNFNVQSRSRIQANNGEALMQAAALGLGITQQPDFIAAPMCATGQVTPILQSFAPAPLGIYAVLPSNRHIPQRVRVLVDFLAQQFASYNAE
jgi:DNA-binding transcriptional LysR family regulator